uniref:Uncharacterized protein n=1 Tax=Oryza rufipogon TaxID=4529 RepID=A0A0E0NP55_ORYRU
PPPSLLPTQKKKKKKTHLLVPFHPHLLLPFRWIPAAVSTSPASPSGVERRRGRWPVRCGVVAGERLLGFAASEKVSGVFWKLRCDAPATARKCLQVCDTGVILLVGWGFAFWSRGGLGGRHGLGPQHGFQVWAW